MRQEDVKTAMRIEWPRWWKENRDRLRGKEQIADEEFVEFFLQNYPQYEAWSRTNGKGVSAKHRMEIWADNWRKDEIIAENARMNSK